MKGSLFPLGQPLREWRTGPEEAQCQDCSPACCLSRSECPGLSASYPGPVSCPAGASLSAGVHTPWWPLPFLSSPVWHHYITEHEWGAPVLGAGFCSLHTCEPCRQDVHKCHEKVLCPGATRKHSRTFTPRGCGLRNLSPTLHVTGERSREGKWMAPGHIALAGLLIPRLDLSPRKFPHLMDLRSLWTPETPSCQLPPLHSTLP